MFHRTDRALPYLAILALVGVAAGAPSIAYAQTSGAAAPMSSTPDKAAQKPLDRVEARIAELHAKLHITAAQEPQWNALVQVMRDNAQQMSAAIQQREQAQKTATALNDLKAYQQIADAHSDGLKKLIPAFESLYGALSDSQKKEADALFNSKHMRKS